MERDGQLELYDRVAARLKDAHRTVRDLQVPEDVRQALARKLLVITAATKRDLPGAARRLERLMADVDQGRLPSDRTGGHDGTP
ncbi:SCO5555 family protein [Streptomyces triticirhizae]|uniref:Uncharacterized protein n=1 Tax=Streptomyces triticirhizae TaxID=2483353 RepID=A0A3M2LGC2_9ACTN|nr:hypothetical protein [Streptomyces triticirhizae]RMI36559.1 hypothetical protein EBN88_21205 [Streptomyces triticirhizae]